MSEITYCEQWNDLLHKPMTPLSQEEARRRHDAGELYTAVLDQPDQRVLVEVRLEADHVGVKWLDENGQPELTYLFTRLPDGRLFLEEVTVWTYDSADPYEPAAATENVHFVQDGTALHEWADHRARERWEQRYEDVPLDGLYEDRFGFGDYADVATRERGLDQPGGADRG